MARKNGAYQRQTSSLVNTKPTPESTGSCGTNLAHRGCGSPGPSAQVESYAIREAPLEEEPKRRR
jgi:hypothetical protein